jgi:hypothetical protein
VECGPVGRDRCVGCEITGESLISVDCIQTCSERGQKLVRKFKRPCGATGLSSTGGGRRLGSHRPPKEGFFSMRHRLSFLMPSPAMAIAVAALIAACSGLAAAATSSSPVIRACANKKTGALRLASKCRRSERSMNWNKEGAQGPRGLTGATGSPGATGATGGAGQTGPQGPGAKQIVSSVTGPRTSFPIATVGPWTVRMECTVGVSVNIVGPGSYYDTTVTGEPGISTPTTTHINNGAMGESGVTANTVGANMQLSFDVQLISGATMYELRLQMTETGSGISNPCTVTGSAIPVN